MSTLPPLWQVIGNTRIPGRFSVWGSGARAIRRGAPSAMALSDSRTTVGCVQLPPSQPWNAPSAVMRAPSPAWALEAGWRRTTVASAKGSSFATRPAASTKSSERMRQIRRDVDVGETVRGPGHGRGVLAVPAHDLPAAAVTAHREDLGEERAVVERRGRVHPAVLRDHERSSRLPIALDERRNHAGR